MLCAAMSMLNEYVEYSLSRAVRLWWLTGESEVFAFPLIPHTLLLCLLEITCLSHFRVTYQESQQYLLHNQMAAIQDGGIRKR